MNADQYEIDLNFEVQMSMQINTEIQIPMQTDAALTCTEILISIAINAENMLPQQDR